jgi:hypothetical protein
MPTLDNAHALLIGIADYQHITKLPRVKDTADLRQILIDPQGGGYLPEHVESLEDAGATQAAIRESLAWLAVRCDHDSTALIYFSGHGGRIRSGAHAGEYLLPVDTVYPADESLAQTAISGAEFTAALQAIPARKVVVIFDCCHAGGIGQPRDLLTAPVEPGLSENYYERLAAGRGRVILASSRSSEYSYVPHGAEYGLFTRHLLDGLRGGIASDDGLIRIFDLFEYVQPRVTADQPRQHPVFKAELEENFPIALRRGGEKAAAPRDAQGFRYDAYISYVDQEPDSRWVWETLVPRLESAGLRIAVSGDVEEPGVARVVGIERGIAQSKRTIVVLSARYLADHMADFENVLAQTMGIQEGAYRLLPVRFESIDMSRLPVRLSMLTTLDLAHPHRAEREWERLTQALKGPLPMR